ncbi:MAG: hypothetical protein WBA76_08065 [Phormidesmis sp.]
MRNQWVILLGRLEFIREVLSPDSVREKFMLSVFWVSTVLLAIALIPNLIKGLLGIAVVGILSSMTAAAFAEYIFQVATKIELLINKRRFSRLFSCSHTSDCTALVVLPEFNTQKTHQEDLPNKSVTDLSSGIEAKKFTLRDLSRREYNVAMEVDVQALSYLTSAFSKIGLQIPQMDWDERILERSSSTVNTNVMNIIRQEYPETYILIGLYSNAIVNEYTNSDVLDNTALPVHPFFYISREDNGAERTVINKLRWAYFLARQPLQQPFPDGWNDRSVTWLMDESKIDDGYDYGLFGKFFYDQKAFIACGATTELGTNNLSKHIAEKWEEAYLTLMNEKGAELAITDPFVVVYKIPVAGQSENITLFDWCIRPLRGTAK